MRVSIIAVFGIILISEIGASTDLTCIQKGQDGSCEFYQCFEKRRQCGPSGYLTGFGHKYCNKFSLNYNKLTQTGKNVLDCVRPCLTKKLLGKYKESVGTGQKCEELKSYAFDTHVSCYRDCKFCSAYASNKLVLNSMFDSSDQMSLKAVKQMSELASSCPK